MMEPKPGITFVTGGARSGKSAYAVELGKRSGGPVVYLATAEPIDDEMRARIARHQAERPAEWQTIEEPLELARRVEDEVEPGATVIVDCMTVWL
ncbi:MAG: bifunctional adenosylcobinamide kinase/adenosylcobinamide-phosphate guanylyltransferase, partial [Chloroflexi bacterium]|nr:bifunctional adenosylcobinamide kinase/adenosylcobinamide-phosphate guanylyltransferase [Chloroflexota bacterium]